MYYVSADCGGTKTAIAITDEKGKAIASSLLGPANYLVNGLDNSVKLIANGVDDLLEENNLSHQEIAHFVIALAGYGDIPREKELIRKAFDEVLDYPFSLVNDIENATAGSLINHNGIHLVAGTGSIAACKNRKGEILRSGGWGHYFGGDEGSGYWIGSKLLLSYCKQSDGRKEKTLLHSYINEHYKLESDEDILLLVLNQMGMRREEIASFALDAVKLYELGDEEVKKIFYEAGEELGELALSLYKKGKDFDLPLRISYSGSIFKSLGKIKAGLDNKLQGIDYQLIKPGLSPLAGGIIIAMEKTNQEISPAIIENLKEIK